MGLSPSDKRESDFPAEAAPPYVPVVRQRRLEPRREPWLRYLVLFALTLVSTTLSGAWHFLSFESGFDAADIDLSTPALLLGGLWYAVGVLGILGAHELGHYFACRYYGVNASRPYFIPLWLPLQLAGSVTPPLPAWLPMPTPGTLGAVIRIRQPLATKRQFFDIGIAGPIAGFVVLVPVLLFAMSLSDIVAVPPDYEGIEFGEPLLFKAAAWLFFGAIPEHHTINLHPTGWAAWFGMLATALNLAPVGQLDGGHISYGVFGRKSSMITVAVTVLLVALLTISMGYVLWTVLVVAMVLVLGPHHPRTPDEAEPLDPGRLALAVFAAVMFVLCFTPVPVELVGL